ncbi:hypothetical protein [Nocardia brasiliensis]|uniref:1-aminocyclopropane-1-carboxylate deaminase n=1 Tax=Nocardia brasiliensis (strain ATCC 700358 / HUJEG-1) TaxID=1133849 RepID=K0F152_NOCB7|nr:hypothetical protein [Nocardia brasiliensis]AFU01416.1 1-aminocyclopropane-1-carboxylate deaminase [Nocardia brasiliensis ATCC 700358]
MSSDPLLHQRFPELADTLPFLRLGTAPTPIRPLDVGPVVFLDTYGP